MPQKIDRKGELQTSRISSNLWIWQPYSTVPQILKVLSVWYSWKYVARLGSDPLKFLYSAFFIVFNAQVVTYIYNIYKPKSWNAYISFYLNIYIYILIMQIIFNHVFVFKHIFFITPWNPSDRFNARRCCGTVAPGPATQARLPRCDKVVPP